MIAIERQLQRYINSIQSWADENGFQFSKSKTVCMHFSNQNCIHAEPDLKLGLVFDRKLTFTAHMKYLKDRYLKALNLLRVVAHKDCGADSATLLKLYRTHVRSKLDFGCVVDGSARPSALESLDRVQNAALRTCLEAFRTSSITSLHVEAGELPLSLRRQQLSLQYIVKLCSNPSNPAFHCVFKLWFQSSVRSETKRYRNPWPQAARKPLEFRNHIEQYR